jgi:hypothetical protein
MSLLSCDCTVLATCPAVESGILQESEAVPGDLQMISQPIFLAYARNVKLDAGRVSVAAKV